MKAKAILLMIIAACILVNSGCASVTNPVAAEGIPVREVPPQYLAKPREAEQLVPLTLLRQEEPKLYKLGPGDVLGVWAEGVLGERNAPPPVQIGTGPDSTPVLGFPIPVRENGTIALPLIAPIRVEGLTLEQAEAEIRKAYTVTKQILQPDAARIIVTLQQARSYQVLVIREDASNLAVNPSGQIAGVRRGTGTVLNLPAYKNDVLNALTLSGGLPGLDAKNEIILLRGGLEHASPGLNGTAMIDPAMLDGKNLPPGFSSNAIQRIPLRLRPEEPIPFSKKDVVLQTGDILFVPERDAEVFYTAGLIQAGEFVLPRNYDLDVIEAIARTNGPIINGNLNQNNFTGQTVAGGLGFPSPSQLTVLRKTKGGGQIAIKVDLNRAFNDPRERILVQAGDILVLQETLGESVGRYFSTNFNYILDFDWLETPDARGFGILRGIQ